MTDKQSSLEQNIEVPKVSLTHIRGIDSDEPMVSFTWSRPD